MSGPFAGFWVTLKQMFPGHRVTTQYPEDKRVKPQRFHGRHVLNRYPDGMEKCIGCELCAGVCPARCIYVRGKENSADAPVSPGERFGFVYEINMLRCIFCGLCVEACPTEAITMTHLFEMSVTDRQDAIYTRSELLMNPDGSVPHPQPDSVLIDKGELLQADGWMRATSPSGRAAYEGIPAWTPTLGAGLRPAEQGQSVGRLAGSWVREDDTASGDREAVPSPQPPPIGMGGGADAGKGQRETGSGDPEGGARG
ncbi:MAG TPA: NADH-quinone oxidoreductase subunit NuoI [Acidimicrobiia bacterium]|nr:NADH-quinone oxidoreductase subunit NuoI [Acidimicrobiia bacterium]